MKKILLCALCILMLCLCGGCTNYSSIKEALAEIEIENTMPEVSDGGYDSLADANDEIYDLQIATCEMYAQAYKETQYKNYAEDLEEEEKDPKIMDLCNERRMELNEEIRTLFFQNLYTIIKDCEDCKNKEAFLEKADDHVMEFYDAYIAYQDADDEREVLCDILVDYAERRNTLALSFLERNERKVYESATRKIEENADVDESYRYYLNKNNYIISALNLVFGGVPSLYASRITDATTRLSKTLLNSYEDLTEYEREVLIEELNLATPTPSPRPTVAPRPVTQATPVPVKTPAPTTRPVITQAPVVRTPAPTEGPSYSFSVDDE